MVVAEGADAVLGSKGRLRLAGLWEAEIIEAEVRREVRLIVAGEQRPAANDLRPLGETLAPPLIVLRDRVELGQVERYDLRRQDWPSPNDERTKYPSNSSTAKPAEAMGNRALAAKPSSWIRSQS